MSGGVPGGASGGAIRVGFADFERFGPGQLGMKGRCLASSAVVGPLGGTATIADVHTKGVSNVRAQTSPSVHSEEAVHAVKVGGTHTQDERRDGVLHRRKVDESRHERGAVHPRSVRQDSKVRPPGGWAITTRGNKKRMRKNGREAMVGE